MESRESRLWLRFESGTHQGKKVPLIEGGLTIGRRSENQLVIADGSVSGKHAEIRSEDGDLVLVDLGSTNGTRVGGARIETHRLAHGDHLHLGNVELVFLDANLGEPVSAPAPEMGAAGPAVGRLAAPRGRSRRGFLGLLLLLVLAPGAVAAWWFLGRGDEGPTVVRVAEVPGNLLANGTFEAPEGGPEWESAASAPQGFYVDTAFVATGAMGLGVALEDAEWALASSPLLAVGPRQAYALRASLWAEDGARGRLGLRFSSTSGAGPDFAAWSRTVDAGDDFVDAELVFTGLPGYDRVRIVVAATATTPGAVSVDDVSLVPVDSAPDSVVRLDESEARLFGPGATTAAFVRSGRVVCPGIDFAPWRAGEFSGWSQGAWTAAPGERGLACTSTGAGAPADAVLEFTVNATERSGASADVILAAIGPGGYRSLAGEFAVEEATDLLVGQGVDLVRIRFAAPLAVSGSMRDGALRIRAETAGTDTFELQFSFVEERTRARDLSDRAAEFEIRGEFGAALDTWTTLLDEVPFDASLVARAEAARARLVQQGMARVDDIRAEVERARFFALAELFRQCRDRATSVGKSFAGSEVEVEVAALVGEIDSELAILEVAAPKMRGEKLRAVLEAMNQDEAPDLTAHIRRALGDDGSGYEND